MKRQNVAHGVSDRALLKWLQLEQGVDVEGARRHLQRTTSDAAAYGATAVSSGKVRLVLSDRGITPGGRKRVVVTDATERGTKRLEH